MPRLGISNHKLETNISYPRLLLVSSYYFLASKSCAQPVHNRWYQGSTNQLVSHMAAYKNSLSVHKQPASTQLSVQTTPTNHPTYTQFFSVYNRLIFGVMPSMHSAYI